MKLNLWTFLLIGSMRLWPTAMVWAAEDKPWQRQNQLNEKKTVVYQSRRFAMKSAIGVGMGSLVANAFYKSLIGQIDYEWEINPWWAIKWIDILVAKNFSSILKYNLDVAAGQNVSVPYLQGAFSVPCLFKPIYGKWLFGKRHQIHFDAALQVAPSLMLFGDDNGKQWVGGGGKCGVVLRYFVNPSLAIHAEFSQFLGAVGSSRSFWNNTLLQIGPSFGLGKL